MKVRKKTNRVFKKFLKKSLICKKRRLITRELSDLLTENLSSRFSLFEGDFEKGITLSEDDLP